MIAQFALGDRSTAMTDRAKIIEITGHDFDEEVLKSDLPVSACFTNSQCGTCFTLCLLVNDLAKEYEGRIKFVRIDVEREPELADRYHVLPCPLYFFSATPNRCRNCWASTIAANLGFYWIV